MPAITVPQPEPILSSTWRPITRTVVKREELDDDAVHNGDGSINAAGRGEDEVEDEAYPSDEWEPEEIEYLTLDFGGALNGQAMRAASELQLLAINSETPYAQVGRQVFAGRHEQTIGSQILLQFNAEMNSYVTLPKPAPTTTSSIISFLPVTLEPRPPPHTGSIVNNANNRNNNNNNNSSSSSGLTAAGTGTITGLSSTGQPVNASSWREAPAKFSTADMFDATGAPIVQPKRGRGRPRGSTNKKLGAGADGTAGAVTARGRGRPRGRGRGSRGRGSGTGLDTGRMTRIRDQLQHERELDERRESVDSGVGAGGGGGGVGNDDEEPDDDDLPPLPSLQGLADELEREHGDGLPGTESRSAVPSGRML